jgi:aconitase B
MILPVASDVDESCMLYIRLEVSMYSFPHLEWDQKKKHVALAQQLSNVKICRVFCGLFLEDGKTVASLAALCKEKIPDTIHVGGDTLSFAEVAEMMQTAGAGPIQVTKISEEGAPTLLLRAS